MLFPRLSPSDAKNSLLFAMRSYIFEKQAVFRSKNEPSVYPSTTFSPSQNSSLVSGSLVKRRKNSVHAISHSLGQMACILVDTSTQRSNSTPEGV